VAILLYRAPFSTNAERVALALAHKGLEAESIQIDYADRSPVIEVSGQPLVPVIVEDGQVISDSIKILRHLENHHPHPPLFPSDAARRAELEVFLEWFDGIWKGPPNAIEAGPAEEETAKLSKQMGTWLDLFERMLDDRDHLFGDAFSAADCAAFPFLKYARSREPEDDELFHRVLDEHQSVEGRPRLAAWIARVDERPRA
jgi:maleylpyruvate isomerase